MRGDPGEYLLTPFETQVSLGVDPQTLLRWADNGQIRSLHTLDGDRRYRFGYIEELVARLDHPHCLPTPRRPALTGGLAADEDGPS